VVRETKHAARGGGRQPDDERDRPLQLATVETVLRLTNGKNGWGHCPCHPDKNPSLEVKRGREPGRTLITCWAGCERDELLTHFRKNGWRLGPMKMAPPRRKTKQAVTVTESVAYGVLTQSERSMYAMISRGENPTYNDFVAEGVHRQAIPGGLRAMQALGLIGVRRSPRKKGCLQYEQNEYWTSGQYPRWEPSGTPAAARKTAKDRAKARAKAARKGDEDISLSIGKPETNKGRPHPEFLVSEVRFRGTDSGTDSYERWRLASKSQDSPRPTTFDEGQRGWSGAGKAMPNQTPTRHRDDPGPTSEAAYGADPPQGPSHNFSHVEGWRPPCGGLACGKAGECLRPDTCRFDIS
jgi:hypothetical protein